MSWHGVDAVDDAIDVTREFLFPFSVGRWIRMVVVTLFTGGGGAGGQVASNAGNFGARLAGTGGFSGPSAGASALAALAVAVPTLSLGSLALGGSVLQTGELPGAGAGAVGALGVLLLVAVVVVALVAILLSPIFEFVLVDAIARDDLRILRDVRTHLTNGLRLLGFRIGLFAAFVVPPAAVIAGVVLSGTRVESLLGRPLVLVALGIVAILYILVFAFLDRFTVEFVVPAMVADGGGVIDGWRRVWPRLRGQPGQTLVYIVMHVLVGIGLSIVSFVLALVGLLAVGATAAGIGFAVGTVTSGAATTDLGIGLGLLAGLAVGVPVFIVAVLLPIQVLTTTYRRSYELAALGRFGGNLDLVGRYRDGDGGDDDGDIAAELRDDGDDGPDGGAGATDADVDAGTAPSRGDEEFGDFVPASSDLSTTADDDEGDGGDDGDGDGVGDEDDDADEPGGETAFGDSDEREDRDRNDDADPNGADPDGRS